jgi:hypothetical protein
MSRRDTPSGPPDTASGRVGAVVPFGLQVRTPRAPGLLGVVMLQGARRGRALPLDVGGSPELAWQVGPGASEVGGAEGRVGVDREGANRGGAARPGPGVGARLTHLAVRDPSRHAGADTRSSDESAGDPSGGGGVGASPVRRQGSPGSDPAVEEHGKPATTRRRDAAAMAAPSPAHPGRPQEDRDDGERVTGTRPSSDSPAQPLRFRMVEPGVWHGGADARHAGALPFAAAAHPTSEHPGGGPDVAPRPPAQLRGAGDRAGSAPEARGSSSAASIGAPVRSTARAEDELAPGAHGASLLVWGAPGAEVGMGVSPSDGLSASGSGAPGVAAPGPSAPGPFRVPDTRRVVQLAARVESVEESARRVAASTVSPGPRRVAGTGTGFDRGGPTPSSPAPKREVVDVRDDGSVRALMDRIRRLEREDRFRRGGLR